MWVLCSELERLFFDWLGIEEDKRQLINNRILVWVASALKIMYVFDFHTEELCKSKGIWSEKF